jgi:hypothetical protein
VESKSEKQRKRVQVSEATGTKDAKARGKGIAKPLEGIEGTTERQMASLFVLAGKPRQAAGTARLVDLCIVAQNVSAKFVSS